MNPDTRIKPWLVAAGKQFGINNAFDHRWADDETSQVEYYFTYKELSSVPTQSGSQDDSTAVNYDVNVKHWMNWDTTFQIDLFNSQNGMQELKAITASGHAYPYMEHIQKSSVAFKECITIQNLTNDETDGELEYHHRMICVFNENVSHSSTDTNGVVETVVLGDNAIVFD